MRSVTKFALGLAVGVAVGVTGFAAVAQKDPKIGTTVNDPIGPVPDPAHVGMTLPKDIKCTGKEGETADVLPVWRSQQAGTYYGVIYIWYPGHFSKPHFHDHERLPMSMSGTWWVSTSNVYDERTTYPVHAGTVSVDVRTRLHWDGCAYRRERTGGARACRHGPVKTIQGVDENGKPKPGQWESKRRTKENQNAQLVAHRRFRPCSWPTPALAETQEQLLTQGRPRPANLCPIPRNIPMVFGKDIPWKGETGEHTAALFGDPNKPGIYGVLIKWDPGHNSKPHFHTTDRYIYVVSGTWWVSLQHPL